MVKVRCPSLTKKALTLTPCIDADRDTVTHFGDSDPHSS